MKYIVEESLRNFQFWSGGKDRADNCSAEELDSIEEFLEEIEPEEGWTDTAINDMFWFEFDTLAQHLGFEDEEDFDRKRDPNYLDDDDLLDYVSDWFEDYLDTVKVNEGANGLMYLYEEIFGEDVEDLCKDEQERADLRLTLNNALDFPEWLGAHAYTFMLTIDSDTLMERLFEDDHGHNELENFPTKEQFRDEIMIQNHRKQ